MRIKEIELDNFKSFGKHTVVPVLGGFTTISGPNGSGKSNIIDSLLFALGLSSTRSMRAERLPDLLNNLSGRSDAKVTVRFTNDAGEELEVSRRIRVKENSYNSTYVLNGKVTTLTDIHDALTKYNVSPTGFNVIMQGDVTGIVTMSGTERRKIIDELAGVAEFDRRIEQARNELEATATKIEEQKIILGEIVSRLETLRIDRDQALKYLALKDEKEAKEKDLIFSRFQELEATIAKEKQELDKLKAKEVELQINLESTELGLLSLRAEMTAIDQEIKEKGGNEQLLLRQELENTRGELTREDNKLSNLNAIIEEKNKLAKNLTNQIRSIDKHINELKKQNKQHLADKEAVDTGLMEKQGVFQAVMAEIEMMRQEKDRSSDKVTTLHLDLQKLQDQKHKIELRQAELQSRRTHLENESKGSRDRLSSMLEKSFGLKSVISSLENSFQDQEAIVLGMERGVKQLEDEIESTIQEIESKRLALESINKRIIQLETTKEVVGESGYGRAIEFLLSKKITGLHGTIGQLGKVDSQYERALEIAIGAKLGHLVVDDDEIAQKGIELLKKHQVGRATFIPLNKISAQPPGLLPNHAGVIDFAYNLVDFNPKFTKAFQYACGQTVVVQDINVARRLINHVRMVTLEGELFDKSGAMTGGNEKSKLHFTSKGESDLVVVKQTAASLNEQVTALQQTLKDLKASAQEDKDKYNQTRTQFAQRQSELEERRKQLIDLEKEMEAAKPQLRKHGEEVESIDAELESMVTSISDVSKHINQIEDTLQNALGGANRSKLDKLVQESVDLRSEIENIEREKLEIQRLVDKGETEVQVEASNQTTLNEQLNTISQEVASLTEQKPQFEENIKKFQDAIAIMESKVKELSAELEDLRQEKEKAHEAITAGEIKRTKIEQDLRHLSEQEQQRKLRQFDLLKDLTAVQEQIELIKAANPDFQPLSQANVEQLKNQVEKLERRMRALEPVNMKALDEYNIAEERHHELQTNIDVLLNEKAEVEQKISGFDELKKRTFMEAFDAININFQEIFAELSRGHGRLELENPDSPFTGGLIIRAQPRDKKMQRIEALSGGEKSLTALSFVFAFQRYAPAPFYAFDEVDMMLDGSNAERLARMVRAQSASAQFVVVSLRRPMIENADHAIGVSLRSDGYSKVVGIQEIKLPTEEELAAQEDEKQAVTA